ncbi:hypothetical protein KY285_007775 [Solanum tuberosum]|nr:hypothetical protein KY285_007775 [Solanum tuberosum]
MGMAKISIANEFGPLHDHDTRHVADMGKDFGGATKVTGKGMEVEILDTGCSDHSPLSINFVQQVELRSRPFKFLNHLAKHEKFQETVKQAWQESGLEARIKKYSHHRQQTQDLQGTMRLPGQPTSLTKAEREAKLNLEKWLNVEESIIRQKSIVQWLKLGDGNTAYFHASLRNRLPQNKIASLTNVTRNIVTNIKDVED